MAAGGGSVMESVRYVSLGIAVLTLIGVLAAGIATVGARDAAVPDPG